MSQKALSTEKCSTLHNSPSISIAHPLEVTFRERIIVALDSAILILPLLAYLSENYFFCLLILNVAVPIVHIHSLETGINAFRRWQGRWKNLEICWMISLSTTACFMALCLLADWYLHKKWNIIGVYDNMMWSYFHYIGARVINMFHRYVRKYG